MSVKTETRLLGLVQPQPLHRLASNQILIVDLLHGRPGDVAVPDGVRVDDHRAAVLAVVEATRLVRADLLIEPAGSQRRLELLQQLRRALARAVTLLGLRRPLVEADEDVLAKRRRHQLSSSPSARRNEVASARLGSSAASARPRTAGVNDSASTRMRGGTARCKSEGSSATTGARPAAACEISSGLAQATHAAMCVEVAAWIRRASSSGGTAPARRRTASAPPLRHP